MYLFSRIAQTIIEEIEKSKKSLLIAVTWFTNHDIFNAILRKLDDKSFNVQLVVLNDRINNKAEGLNFQAFVEKGGVFYYSENENMVHHKFCIIDERILINGSYNWTYYAENRNWENLIIIDETETVRGFISEFERIISKHEKVLNIASCRSLVDTNNQNGYLEADYTFQAKEELKKGNDLGAAKIYTEILRINKKSQEIAKTRTEILKKYNTKSFEVSPFEIGLDFKNGYATVIPAFVKLPFEATKNGLTASENQTSVSIAVQKNEFLPITILKLELKNITPSPLGSEKIIHELKLYKTGLLTVVCKEIGGNAKPASGWINIKSLI